MPDHIELIWKEVNITYEPKKSSKDQPKTIIHTNSGKIISGEFLALMGATGFLLLIFYIFITN